MIFLIYPSTSQKIFEFFICDELDDGQRYLGVDYSINCEAPMHRLMQGYATVMLFVYPFGAPLLYALCMLRYREVLLKLQRRELRRAGTKTAKRIRRNSKDLGAPVLTASLIVKEERTSAEGTGARREQAPRKMHVVLHGSGCLAWHVSSHVPVPLGKLHLSTLSSCDIDGEVLLITGTERSEKTPGAQLEVALRALKTASDLEVTRPPPPAVVLATWQKAVKDEIESLKQAAERKNSDAAAAAKGAAGYGKEGEAEEGDDSMDAAKALRMERMEVKAALPAYFKKLVGPYEMRVFYFEIFECLRKISLIGLPVFFAPGTLEQTVLGLLICFLSFGAYMALSPFRQFKHDLVSQLSQLQIFLTFLIAVLLKGDRSEMKTDQLDRILCTVSLIPPFCCAIIIAPTSKYFLDEDKRERVLRFTGRMLGKLAAKCDRCVHRRSPPLKASEDETAGKKLDLRPTESLPGSARQHKAQPLTRKLQVQPTDSPPGSARQHQVLRRATHFSPGHHKAQPLISPMAPQPLPAPIWC